MQVVIDTSKIILSAKRNVYKTEGFISLTKKTSAIDRFASRTAESIFAENLRLDKKSYCAKTGDGLYTLFFTAGGGDNNDIIFYGYRCKEDGGGFDRRLCEYLSAHKKIKLDISETQEGFDGNDLKKLYLLSSSDGIVNFPLLNKTQKKIVETEDANMLVQGIAGSGKTNVCVEKVVYCACRDYRGKVLYTTFSRGLLAETRDRVELFLKNIEDFTKAYAGGNVVFLDADHKKSVENKIGISFSVDGDGQIMTALLRIADFLKNKVEYLLIEDIYSARFEKRKVADESVFLNEYLGGKNYRLSGAVDRIKNIAPEIIYKEIYGMIFGKYSLSAPSEMMSREEYALARADSFRKNECDTIYSVAADYLQFLKKNGYTDNNLMSRALLNAISSPVYSVAVVDEVQDFTQVNLCLVKKLARKLFCVGDALQMINPSYFNFGYLKSLMYGDVTGVEELTHNYRSTQKIESIAEKLGEMNIGRFGTHSFVLKGRSVASPLDSSAVFVKDKNFVYSLDDKKYENATIVVASERKKEKLKKSLGKIEILTVAEAKGLERNTVILADVLSDSIDKWQYLENLSLNRKTADENSVYRYYFNLFYVGISRAKQHLFVCEREYPKSFESLFNEKFERKSKEDALAYLKECAGRILIDDGELTERIEKFCSLGQYANARDSADRMSDERKREEELAYIFVHEKYLRFSSFREAGVEYWRRGLDAQAREMFTRSGDTALFPLMDACKEGGGALDPEIVRFYPLAENNEAAKKIILDTLQTEAKELGASIREINDKFKAKRKRQ